MTGTPRGDGRTRDYVPDAAPAAAQGARATEQAPLGDHPSYDDVLDVAVQYTFPCSDPIAVHSSSASAAGRSPFADDPQPQPTDTTSRPR
jgi:hypothetical protein